MRSRACVFPLLMTACSMAASPPPSPGLYQGAAGPAPAPTQASMPAPAPAPAPTPAPVVTAGVLRVVGASTACSDVVAVHDDGGATLLCSLEREEACALIEIGADGEERRRSEPVPGTCHRWAPREGGGGFLLTHREASLAITALGPDGRRGPSTSFESAYAPWASDARVAPDGGLYVALSFSSGALTHRRTRLGKTKYTVPALVKLTPALDRIAWSRVFDQRTTKIASLLQATAAGVDAVIATKGPLVPGGPMEPTADDGAYGGNTYGWRSERVAFGARGKPGARSELPLPATTPVQLAELVDDALVTMSYDRETGQFALTIAPRDGEPRHERLRTWPANGLDETNDRTWVLACDCAWGKEGLEGKWLARELGGERRVLELTGLTGKHASWHAIAVRGDHVVALGTSRDPKSQIPVQLAAFARIAPEVPALDVRRLSLADRFEAPAGCTGRTQITPALLEPLEPELEACDVPVAARLEVRTYTDGGLRTVSNPTYDPKAKKLSPKVLACARRTLAPLFTCPVGGTMSFMPRPPPAS